MREDHERRHNVPREESQLGVSGGAGLRGRKGWGIEGKPVGVGNE